ncbi:DUF4274 domain-containing protein [Rhizobium ruizarguesonis]|jgi:hypothetical protein|uniref:DUF4274 domain-containing protein n=1 Tax=Rhizobium ruizarguesonis TaxID=2081791 RepID=UPI001FE00937|nr:DUF4274 domain-containing protein [Rhizobium ruizarguesonis]
MDGKFESYAAEQRAMIDWLTGRSPDARHAIAQDLNFDFAEDVFEWILTQPDCDLATAASYFWRTEPFDLLENSAYRSEDSMTVQRLIDRVNAGFYSRSEIFYGGQEPREGEEVDSSTLEEAELLREFAHDHKASNLPWTLPEALVPPFGHRAVRISDEEDPDKSEELRKLFAGLGTGSGLIPAEAMGADQPPGKMPQPAQQFTVGKKAAASSRSPFTPFYLYIAFVAAGWGLIYVFDPPRHVYTVMLCCCLGFARATFTQVRFGMKEKADKRVQTVSMERSVGSARVKPQGIYILDSNGNYGWEFANWDRLQPDGGGLGLNYRGAPWPDSMLDLPRGPWRIPDYVETPTLIFDPKRKVQDIYAVDYFLFISDKMKSLLEEFAPKSCEYLLCETEFSNGKTGPRIWLCSVVDSYRKAVDVENSPLIRVTQWGGYMISGGADWHFLPDVLKGTQLFRLVEYAGSIFCDQTFKDLCKDRGIKGTSFQQVGFLPK